MKSNHVHITGYFQCPMFHSSNFVRFCQKLKENKITISLDIQLDPAQKYESNLQELLPLIDIFFPNEIEAMGVTKKSTVTECLEYLCAQFPKTLNIIKCGKNGCIAGRSDQRWDCGIIKIPQVIDSLGAGDSFASGFLISFITQKMSIESSLRFATAVAALAITKEGGPANYEWHQSELSKLLQESLTSF